MRLESFGATTEGRVREHNEDAFLIDPEHRLFLVADGMGGHAAGEVASRIAVETVSDLLTADSEEQTWPFDDDPRLSRDANRLVHAVRLANRRILEASRREQRLRGMGTTLVAMWFLDDARGRPVAYIAHVGDSRIYRFRGGKLEQLTSDHSWIHAQVQSGAISAESARSHPLRNVITRALGSEEDVEVDLLECELRDGDLFLLCSDGLNTMLEDEEIRGILEAKGGDLAEACEALLERANARGGEDNTTVVLVRVQSLEN